MSDGGRARYLLLLVGLAGDCSFGGLVFGWQALTEVWQPPLRPIVPIWNRQNASQMPEPTSLLPRGRCEARFDRVSELELAALLEPASLCGSGNASDANGGSDTSGCTLDELHGGPNEGVAWDTAKCESHDTKLLVVWVVGTTAANFAPALAGPALDLLGPRVVSVAGALLSGMGLLLTGARRVR